MTIHIHDVPNAAHRMGTKASLTVVTCDGADLPMLRDHPDARRSPHNTRISGAQLARERKQGKEMPAWYGGLSDPRAGSAELLRDGWSEGAARIRTLAEQVQSTVATPASVKRRQVWGDDGDELHVERLLAGDVDTMWRATRRTRIGRGLQVVSLAFQWGGNQHITAEQMFWCGAAAAVIADLLDEAGYAVELHAINYTVQWYAADGAVEKEGGLLGDTLMDVMVKSAGEMLQRDKLATLCAHAGVFRTFGFDGIIAASHPVDGDGLGHCEPNKVEETAAHVGRASGGLFPAPDLFIAPAHDAATALASVRQAFAWLEGEE